MSSLTSSLTVKLIDDVSKPARSVAQALKDAETAARNVAKGMANAGASDRLVTSLSKLKATKSDIEQVAAAWKDYAKSAGLAASASEWTKAQTAGVKQWERQTISSLRDVKAEQTAFYRNQARSLQEAERQQKESLASSHRNQMHALQEAERQRKESSIWSHRGAGGMLLAAGAGYASAHGIIHASEATIEKGAEYQHERVALSNAGRTPADLARMEKAARDASLALPTASYIESLKAINETTSAFGSVDHAIENLPFIMRTASVLKSAAGDKITDDPGEMGNKLARFFEERGTAGNPEVFRKEADEMVRAMVFTRGNFNPSEMLNFAQQAKSSLQNYSLPFLSHIIPALVTTMGGERAGTSANAFSSVVMGKARDKKQTAAWLEYGLLDPKKVSDKKDSWTGGAVKNTNLALTNPLEWAETTLLPALKAHGVNTNDKLELSKALSTMFRNQLSNAFINEMSQAQTRARFHKDSALIDQTGTPEEIYNRNLAQDPTASVTALTASLTNLETSVSSPAMQVAARAITSVATALQALAAAAKDHPITAMTAGGLMATGDLAGAGWLSYKIATGFGLPAAATELTAAAVALDGAAARLGAGGVASSVAKGAGIGGAGAATGAATALGTAAIPVTLAVVVGGAAAGLVGGITYGLAKAGVIQATPDKGLAANVRDRDSKSAPVWSPSRYHGPEGTNRNGTAAKPYVDTSQIDSAARNIAEAKTAFDALNATATPIVDPSGLDSFIAKIAQARSGLASLGSAASGLGSVSIPALGRTQRGNFTAGGISGE